MNKAIVILTLTFVALCSFQKQKQSELPTFYFAYNTTAYSDYSDSLDTEQDTARLLNEIKTILMTHRTAKLQIIGNADLYERNPDSLAQARADKIFADLAKISADTTRLKAISWGTKKLYYDKYQQDNYKKYNKTVESMRHMNRRVVLRFI